MARAKTHPARKSSAPDQDDVKHALDAIYADFGANAEIHIYMTLAGDLIVECCTDVVWPDGSKGTFGTFRVASSASAPLLTLMMVCIHRVYADLGLYEFRQMPEGKR